MRTDKLTAYGIMDCRRLNASGSWSIYQNSVSASDSNAYVRSRSDVIVNKPSVDGWRKPSPYSVTVTEKSYASVNCELASKTDPRVRWFHSGNLFPNGFSPLFQVSLKELTSALPPTSVETECVTKALNQVADRKGNLLESVAELKSTVAGLASNATTVSNFLSAAVRKDWRAAAKALGLAPNSRKARRARDRTIAAGGGAGSAWLNYWFGLSPIVSDMVFAMVILNQDREIRLKGTGVAAMQRTSSVKSVQSYLGYSTANYSGTYTQETKAGAKAVLWYSMRTAQLARFNELGLYDVPATAWALMPYSFAVDWVIPVSSILRAWTADVGLSFRGGSFTRFTRIEKKEPDFRMIDSSSLTVVKGGTIDVLGSSGFRMERKVYTTTPRPTALYVTDPLSVWTAVTSLALLGTRIKSIFSTRQ